MAISAMKDDESDNVVAADNKLTEGLNHLAGSGGAFAAVQQDAPGCGQIKRQSHQRQQENQAGKHRELDRPQNWMAVSSTSTDAVMLRVSSRSSAKLGSGTSMTNTSATAPAESPNRSRYGAYSSIPASCSLRPHNIALE